MDEQEVNGAESVELNDGLTGLSSAFPLRWDEAVENDPGYAEPEQG